MPIFIHVCWCVSMCLNSSQGYFHTTGKIRWKKGNYNGPKTQYYLSSFLLKCQGQKSCFSPNFKFPILNSIQILASKTVHLKHILHGGKHIRLPCGLYYSETYTFGNKWKIYSVLWTVAAKSIFLCPINESH